MRHSTKPLVPLSLKLMPKGRRRWRIPRWLRWVGIGLGVLAVVVLCLTAVYYSRAKNILDRVKHAEKMVKYIPVEISAQKFTSAHEYVKKLRDDLEAIDHAAQGMQGLKWWPYVGRQYTTGVKLVGVAQDGTTAVDAMVSFAANIFSPLADKGKVNMASITSDERGLILKGMSGQESELKAARDAVLHGESILQTIPDHGLLGPLQRVVGTLKQQYPLIVQGVNQAIPATRVLPVILGYPDPKTYLFLLENNTELRPGGGFIGTYGVMHVKNAAIESLKTDNSYNLDKRADSLPKIAAPDPMVKYNRATKWYFRDANWSPDFPTSAKQALFLYQREGGEKNIDGVWAMTPTLISKLIGLVGSITIYGATFTEENLTDKLQYYVDLGYKNVGVDASQRKDIIGALTKELVDRLLRLPLTQWKDLFLVLSDQLQQKQFLMYMQDPALQSVLQTENWAGAIANVDGADSILVADANLGALKSDPAVERTYNYQINLTGDRPEATLTITYHHTGKFGWKTTRYRTYTRVYVPAGSELISAAGAMVRDRSTSPGQVLVSSELGKTVFGAFKSIEPQTDGTLTFHYRLPAAIGDQLKKNTYRLLWQKEAGLLGLKINLTVNATGHKPSTTDGLDNESRISKDTVLFSGPLTQDRDITVTYK